MSNKDALQQHNTRLSNNNVDLTTILSKINELSQKEDGIVPTGTLDITENGNYDVTDYASANVNVASSGGGSAVTKGIVINNIDEAGDVTDVSLVGMTEIPGNYFQGVFSYPNAFYQATLHLPDNLTKIMDGAFQNSDGLISLTLPESISDIRGYAFNGCKKLSNINIPNGITRINQYTFMSCNELLLTSLPDGITQIDYYAFGGCYKMALTKLPDSLRTLGTRAFYNCYDLAIKEVPSAVTVIPEYCFYYCKNNLTELTLRGNITRIDNYAFGYCSNLTRLVIPNITSVPTLSNTYAFRSTPIASGTGYIYVPDTLVDSFKSASNWSSYANAIKPISELGA